ncbi:homoserine kinase [Glutamicibacter sp. PS]|uniref:homoserine kinase n=1 Tax=Glutamicibacter sp. PS TaxID=3075634 RepID=UPI00284BC72F|nr:homoserine kinase [Glutamicibacter sp. PS]MDR4533158.1 homoserine kinase [Glutamicibacter sp. PS]
MSATIALGQHLRICPPATSANLGPGFDSFGLALDYRDELLVSTAEHTEVVVHGEGAESLPRDESHLIVAKMREYWAERGVEPVGVRLEATNNIPHARGMGSSAAAIVAAYAAADALLPPALRGGAQAVFQAAAAWEGHPDNVAPAVFGGLSISASLDDGEFSAVPLPVHSAVRAVLAIPSTGLSTHAARSVLPEQIDHSRAAANSAATGLLVHAIGHAPQHLLAGTRDYLHQDYRAEAMPESAELIRRLREAGLAAVVSGAGPTVLTLVSTEADEDRAQQLIEGYAEQLEASGNPVNWRIEIPALARNGVTVEVL